LSAALGRWAAVRRERRHVCCCLVGCQLCLEFTPKLAEWYRAHAAGLGLGLVFVSFDSDQPSFDECVAPAAAPLQVLPDPSPIGAGAFNVCRLHRYFAEMPWLALPYLHRELKKDLARRFKVQGVPALVILDAEGQLCCRDGRERVLTDQPESFPWVRKTFWEVMLATDGDSGSGAVIDQSGDHTSCEDLRAELDVLGIYFSAACAWGSSRESCHPLVLLNQRLCCAW
jgi:nucleoredoxin